MICVVAGLRCDLPAISFPVQRIEVEVQAYWPCEAVIVGRPLERAPMLNVPAAVLGQWMTLPMFCRAGQTYAVEAIVLMMVHPRDGEELVAECLHLLGSGGQQLDCQNETLGEWAVGVVVGERVVKQEIRVGLNWH